MKVSCQGQEKLTFKGSTEKHSVMMDTKGPLGNDSAVSPKQMLLLAVCGCSAMDVISLLKKYRQNVDQFHIEAEADVAQTHPAVFTDVRLEYKLSGQIDPEKAMESVHLSQSKFCGVSAMVAASSPIHYKVFINDALVGEGAADFYVPLDSEEALKFIS